MCNTNKKPLSESDIHDQEHKKWNRRSFLQALGLVGGGTIMLGGTPVSASKVSPLAMALNQSESDRILVLIRLEGGNDGLNTIVPLDQYGIYEQLRPTIKHNKSDLYELSSNFGIPNYMSEMQNLWGEGALKIVHGVGYENASLSHFRGSDIWASTDANDTIETGWLGRYFEGLYPDYLVNPPAIPAAIQIGSVGNLIFDGDNSNYAFSVANPNQLESIAQNGALHQMSGLPGCTYGSQLEFMRGTTNTTFNYAETIFNAYNSSTNTVSYPDQKLGRQLANVARMIKGNLGTKIYMVTIGSFDTHANQADDHQSLLMNLSNSVKLFFDDLADSGHDQNVLAMTISEFGRRPDENGSNGTDHGAASPLLLFGPGLQDNGFIGNHPSLSTLDDNGNLIYDIDFRAIYATVLQEWLCINPSVVNQALLGQTFNTINLGFNCATLSQEDFDAAKGFTHFVQMKNNNTIISIKNPSTQHIDIKLYDILGKEIATLKNELLFPGNYNVNVKNAAKTRLSTGQYIYRISVGNQHYSKSILIK